MSGNSRLAKHAPGSSAGLIPLGRNFRSTTIEIQARRFTLAGLATYQRKMVESAMRKMIKADHVGRISNLGWVSFQPDGSISFGLSDRTYVSPRLCIRHFVWSAFNRITSQYIIPNDPSTLLPVRNPHFTYHPAAMFHLKANIDKKAEDEAIFEGIADLGLVLHQQGEMPWIRATSAPLSTRKPPGKMREGNIQTDDLLLKVPAVVANASVNMALDFVRPDAILTECPKPNIWQFTWHKVGLRIQVTPTTSQVATLSWFHSS